MNDPLVSAPTPPIATPPTEAVTIPAVPPEASHAEHASRMQMAFSVLRGLFRLATSPAIVDLLPPQDREYAAAIIAVEQVIVGATDGSADVSAVSAP